MAKCIFSDGTVIGDGNKPYIVAEVNSSHGGNIETAKKMVDTAKEIGCNCVKFQSWSTDSLYSTSYYRENPIAKRIVKKFSLTFAQQKEMAEYCRQIGIAFASTPYSKDEVDFLVSECDVPFIKVASMDLVNGPFLTHIAKTGKPIVLATGMSYLDEIRQAVSLIEKNGNRNLCLLHCISVYPAEASLINLRNMTMLQKEFPEYPVGFSDHSIGTEMAAAATAMGAALIEKHFTLDKSIIGMDNAMATEPEEFSQLVKQCENVYYGLGNEDRTLGDQELKQRQKMQRSVVVTRSMKKGEILTLEDLDLKRPGVGIPPNEMESLKGRTLNRDVEADTLLRKEDLL